MRLFDQCGHRKPRNAMSDGIMPAGIIENQCEGKTIGKPVRCLLLPSRVHIPCQMAKECCSFQVIRAFELLKAIVI